MPAFSSKPPVYAPLTVKDPITGNLMLASVWATWFLELQAALEGVTGGETVTIATAPLSTTPGSMTFVNGVLTDQTPAT